MITNNFTDDRLLYLIDITVGLLFDTQEDKKIFLVYLKEHKNYNKYLTFYLTRKHAYKFSKWIDNQFVIFNKNYLEEKYCIRLD